MDEALRRLESFPSAGIGIRAGSDSSSRFFGEARNLLRSSEVIRIDPVLFARALLDIKVEYDPNGKNNGGFTLLIAAARRLKPMFPTQRQNMMTALNRIVDLTLAAGVPLPTPSHISTTFLPSPSSSLPSTSSSVSSSISNRPSATLSPASSLDTSVNDSISYLPPVKLSTLPKQERVIKPVPAGKASEIPNSPIRPPLTWLELVTESILSNPRHLMTVTQISRFIKSKYSYYESLGVGSVESSISRVLRNELLFSPSEEEPLGRSDKERYWSFTTQVGNQGTAGERALDEEYMSEEEELKHENRGSGSNDFMAKDREYQLPVVSRGARTETIPQRRLASIRDDGSTRDESEELENEPAIKKIRLDGEERPSFTWIDLITEALLVSPNHSATKQELGSFIISKYSYFLAVHSKRFVQNNVGTCLLKGRHFKEAGEGRWTFIEKRGEKRVKSRPKDSVKPTPVSRPIQEIGQESRPFRQAPAEPQATVSRPKSISFSPFIAQAILSTSEKVMSRDDIYLYLAKHYPASIRAVGDWKSKVNNTLNGDSNFHRLPGMYLYRIQSKDKWGSAKDGISQAKIQPSRLDSKRSFSGSARDQISPSVSSVSPVPSASSNNFPPLERPPKLPISKTLITAKAVYKPVPPPPSVTQKFNYRPAILSNPGQAISPPELPFSQSIIPITLSKEVRAALILRNTPYRPFSDVRVIVKTNRMEE